MKNHTSSHTSSLLPSSHSEFRSKAYWDEFFRKRGNDAFEWYGGYPEISPCIVQFLDKKDNILMIGCGNSNFSAELYDSGYHNIVNLDFSELVINDMKEKNLQRPLMSWIVGDMTNMETLNSKSFDAIIDKGALDALMSEKTSQTTDSAKRMFSEIDRLLTENGKYYCISLAESFICESLLQYFGSENIGWQINIYTAKLSSSSPFIPFIFVISRTPEQPSSINMFVNQIGETVTTALAFGVEEARGAIEHIQQFHQMTFKIGKFLVGRFETIYLWSGEHPEIPRFTIFVLDVVEKAAYSCAIFLVPFGRETEYQFTTQHGLTDVALQANCRRLVAVCCNKPHKFPDMAGLQDELNPIAMSLRPRDMAEGEKIPYMAVDTVSDWDTLVSASTEASGAYLVEEAPVKGSANSVYRRLIFLQNQNFVQSEVRLHVASRKHQSGKGGKKGKKSGGGKSGKGEAAAISQLEDLDYEFDHAYLDDHHRGMLCSLLLSPQIIHQGKAVASGKKGASSEVASCLLIGLGGGALPMCIQRYLPGLHLWVSEIDPALESVAAAHFGFKTNSRTHVVGVDGLLLIERIYQNATGTVSGGDVSYGGLEAVTQLDALVMDVDSKDPSLGLSAPPKAFFTAEMLRKMDRIVRSGGIVYFNVVARAKSEFSAFLGQVREVFLSDSGANSNRIYSLKASEETVNIGVIIVKGGAAAAPTVFQGKASKSGKQEARPEHVTRSFLLDEWLQAVSIPMSALQLDEVNDKIKEISSET